MRQVILDTETTGLEADRGHRIIEIGCVEVISRRATGRHFHEYVNPEREIDAGAAAVHGMTLEKLAGKPRFFEIAERLLEFIDGAELVIHNAPFDVAFLDRELGRWAELTGAEPVRIRARCGVVLATGGWEGDEELCRSFEGLPGWHSPFPRAIRYGK